MQYYEIKLIITLNFTTLLQHLVRIRQQSGLTAIKYHKNNPCLITPSRINKSENMLVNRQSTQIGRRVCNVIC